MNLHLDEMISPRVADGLRRRGHDVVTAAERAALGRPDAHQLALAINERRALVTYDVRDFSVLAKAAAVAGREHWGIIFVPRRHFLPNAIGGLVDALDRLLTRSPERDALRDRAVFLERA